MYRRRKWLQEPKLLQRIIKKSDDLIYPYIGGKITAEGGVCNAGTPAAVFLICGGACFIPPGHPGMPYPQ
jgi:hypothetical protein